MEITRRKDLTSYSPGKGNPIITPFVGSGDTPVGMFEIYIPAGVTAAPHTHAGSSLALHVIAGAVIVTEGEKKHRLTAGHSVYVGATEEIGLENNTGEAVRIIAAVGPGNFLGGVVKLPVVPKDETPNISYGVWVDREF